VLYRVTSLLHIDPGACSEELASKQFFLNIPHTSDVLCSVYLLSSVSEIQFLMWHCTVQVPSCSLKHLEEQTNYQLMSNLEI